MEKAAGEHFIRAVGRVAPDEKRVYRLVAGTDGWIRETYANDTGTLVKKDERLASFYSPQFRAAQLAYIATLSPPDDQRQQPIGRPGLAPSQQASVTLQTYIDALESLGMSEKQMKDLAATKQLTDRVYIMAPATGYVIARNVSAGQRFDKGTEWYQIANLDKVWILADLFPNDAGDAKPGVMARVTLPGQNKEFHAAVTKVLPQLDPVARTVKLRLELDNPGHLLRPDMLVNVELPVARPAALTVPADAILASGLRNTVFVDRGNGYFEPREVETGWRHGGRVEDHQGARARRADRDLGQFPDRLRKQALACGYRHAGHAGKRRGLRAGDIPAQGREGGSQGQPGREDLLLPFRRVQTGISKRACALCGEGGSGRFAAGPYGAIL